MNQASESRVRDYLQDKYLLGYIIVFASYFLAARLGQYIFFGLNSPPAVILPSAGIALAAILLGGYRMGVPIFFAQFFATITRSDSFELALLASVANTLQPLIGTYLICRFRIEISPEKDQNVNDLVTVGLLSIAIAAISPTIINAGQFLIDPGVMSPLFNWINSWIGGIFSIFILTPFILTWVPWRSFTLSRKEAFDLIFSFALLFIVNYLLFWTTYLQGLGIIVIFFLPAVLVWFAFHFSPRWLTLALLITAITGIAGSIAVPSLTTPISSKLFSVEIYIGFIAGIFYLFTGVVNDRRRAYQKLKEHNAALTITLAKLSEADKAKVEFIATLAHELRNPLAPVVSALELLQIKLKELHRDDLKNTLNIAHSHLATITRLLEDLLDISRISKKKLHLKKELVEVQSVVHHCIETIDAFYKSKHHILSLQFAKDPVWVEADPIRLTQIITNLLFNAGKYTPPYGRILVSVVLSDEKNVRISVKDSGIGIPSELHSRVFEPFMQIQQSSAYGSGLGIGLSLTKWLVDLHGGKVWVESEGRNMGSKFVVELPLASSPEPMPVKVQKNIGTTIHVHNDPMQHEPTTGKLLRRILVVDDNEAAANGLRTLLEYDGHKVDVAYNGEKALRLVRNPDQVVLLDIGLPDMTGYEVAKILRQKYPNITLIALTGYGQEDDKLKSKQAGFDFHLTKPVGIADIENIIKQLA